MPCRITLYQKEQWRIAAEQEKRQREELKERIRQRRERLQQAASAINGLLTFLDSPRRREAGGGHVGSGGPPHRHDAQSGVKVNVDV